MTSKKEIADFTSANANEKSANSNNRENSNTNPTQCQQILAFMEVNGSITSLDAMIELGCMRLASRISELKKRGYYIVTEKEPNSSGKGYHARYRLGGEE